VTTRGSVDAVGPFQRGWPLRRVIIPFARGLRVLHRARAHGTDRIPRDQPVIFVGKHPRTYLYLETVMLGLFAFWDNDKPPIRVLERRGTSLHRTPLVGWMRRNVNTVPATHEHALQVLRRGESILIYPGGTRELYGRPNELRWTDRTGFARLALEANVPILPFAIIGADGQHPFRVRVGRSSIWLPPFPLPVKLDYWFGNLIPPTSATGHGVDPDDAARDLAEHVLRATRSLITEGLAARRPAVEGAPSVYPSREQTARSREQAARSREQAAR